MTPLGLTLSDPERSKSRSPRFVRPLYHKGAQLGTMLLLNINRIAYMGSPMAPSHLRDLERLNTRPPRVQSLISCK